MRTARGAALAWLALAVAVSAPAGADPPLASPPSKQACAQAYADGQHLRADGKLLAARDDFVLCAQQTCPQAARTDCAQWLVEVGRALPSIAVHAVDASGSDVTDVGVSVDGVRVASTLSGQPLDLDPGARRLRFEHAGSVPVERQLVAVAGDKLRPIEIRFTLAAPGDAGSQPPPAAVDARGAPAESSSTMHARAIPVASWALAGGGLAAFALAGGLWASAQSDYDHLIATCAPRCDPSLSDGGRTKTIVGDVAAVAGGAALGAAVLWYFLRSRRPSVAGAADALDIVLSPHTAIVGARVAF